MDLELTDEQQWLSESVETLLERESDSPWQARMLGRATSPVRCRS